MLVPVECGNPKVIETLKHNGRSISKDWLKAIPRDGKTYCGWCNKNELPADRRKYCSDECQSWSSAFCYPQTDSMAFMYYMERQEFKCAGCGYDYGNETDEVRKKNAAWFRKMALSEIHKIKTWIPNLIEEERARIKTYDPMEDKGYRTFTPNGGVRFTFPRGCPLAALKSYRKWMIEAKKEFQRQYDSYRKLKNHKGRFWVGNSRDVINAKHRELNDGKWTEVDHIIPVAAGGTTLGFENFQVLCHSCHKEKTIRDRIEIREFKRLHK